MQDSQAASDAGSQAPSGQSGTSHASGKREMPQTAKAAATAGRQQLKRALAGGSERVVVHKSAASTRLDPTDSSDGGGSEGRTGADSTGKEANHARRVRWSHEVAGGAGSPGDQEVSVRSVLHGGPIAGRQATPGFKKGFWGNDEAGGWDISDDEVEASSNGSVQGDAVGQLGSKRRRPADSGSSLGLQNEHSGRNIEDDDWEDILDEGKVKKVMEGSREERWQETTGHAAKFDDVARQKAKKRRAESELRSIEGDENEGNAKDARPRHHREHTAGPRMGGAGGHRSHGRHGAGKWSSHGKVGQDGQIRKRKFDGRPRGAPRGLHRNGHHRPQPGARGHHH